MATTNKKINSKVDPGIRTTQSTFIDMSSIASSTTVNTKIDPQFGSGSKKPLITPPIANIATITTPGQPDSPVSNVSMTRLINTLVQSYLSTYSGAVGSSYRANIADVANSVAYVNVTGKPSFATVATSGSYNDLLNAPSLASYATQSYVTTAISNLVDGAPAALDTLKELANSLANNSSYASTITSALAGKVDTSALASYATTTYVDDKATWANITGKPALFSGSYADLTNKPTLVTNLDSLSDVTITTASSGQVLKYNGTAWINDAASGDIDILNGRANVTGTANTVGGGATVGVRSILAIDSAFGSNDANDPASAQAIRGRVTGSNLTKTRNYVAGVTGQYLVTGTNASEFINTGLLGVVGDQTTTANAAVVAYLDGDGGLTTAGSAYGVSMKNSTPGSGFDYGLDLQFIDLNVAGTTAPFKQADIRFNNGVELVANVANTISLDANLTVTGITLSQGTILSETANTTVITPPGALAGQSLVIRPTAGINPEDSHIHLVADDTATVDLYLGDDDQYVKIEKNGGNVVIGTDENSRLWTFDNNGNLTLPANTFAVNYANGTQVSIGGGGNTGNVTFSDQVVMGTGGNDGTGGLYLAPGNTSIASSAVQYLRVRGGDVATHIHLDTGNNAYYDQYFGDDGKYVKLANTGNIVINSNDDAGNTAQWTFDTTGTLTLPEGSTIDETTEIVTVTLDQFTAGGYSGTQVFTKVSDTQYELSPTGPYMALVSSVWRLRVGPATYYDSPDLVTWSPIAGSLPAPVGTLGTVASMKLTVDGNDWVFNNTGNLTLPSGGDILVDNGKIISADGEDFKIIVQDSNDDGNRLDLVVTDGTDQATRVEVDIDGMQIHTNLLDVGNSHYWAFNSDGNLNLPGNLVIAGNANVFGTNSSLLQTTDNRPLIALSSGANGTVSSLWAEDIGNVGTSNIAAVYANPTVGSGIVRIAVGQNGVGSGPNLWDFGTDGNLTLPGNTFAVNYANGTQVSLGAGGGGGIALTDISVGTPNTASGGGSLSYANSTGVFTYTPPVIPDVSGFALSTDIPDVSGFVTGTPWTSAGYLTTITNIFDQSLNTTNNVTFNSVITSNVYAVNGAPAIGAPTNAVGGAGSLLTISAGDGGIAATGINAGIGGNLTITAGDAGSDIGNPSWGNIGGNLILRGGNSSRPYHGSDVQIHSGNSVISPGLISLHTGTNQWTFGKTGDLTLANSATIIAPADNDLTLVVTVEYNICTLLTPGSGYDGGGSSSEISGGSGTGMIVGYGYGLSGEVVNDSVVVTNPGTGYVDGDVLTMTAGSGATFVITRYNSAANPNTNTAPADWTFGTDGTTTFPTNISINYSGNNAQFPRIIADSGKAFSIQAQGSTGSTALSWTVDPDAAGQYAAVAVTREAGLAKVVLQAQSDSGDAATAKLWKFDETGNLTLPVGGDIVDSNNKSVIRIESPFSIKSADFSAIAGGRYGVNTTSVAVTATLPASPATGIAIYFADAGGAFASNNLIIARNGQTIMGLASDMTVNTNDQSFGLFYNGTTWRVY